VAEVGDEVARVDEDAARAVARRPQRERANRRRQVAAAAAAAELDLRRGSAPTAVTFVLPYGSICPPERNIRSRPPRAARSKSSSKRRRCEARRSSDQSFEVAGMKAGSGSSA